MKTRKKLSLYSETRLAILNDECDKVQIHKLHINENHIRLNVLNVLKYFNAFIHKTKTDIIQYTFLHFLNL